MVTGNDLLNSYHKTYAESSYKIVCQEEYVDPIEVKCPRVGTLIVATIYLELIQNRYMFRSFTVLQCSHQHCVQLLARDVEVVGYL